MRSAEFEGNEERPCCRVGRIAAAEDRQGLVSRASFWELNYPQDTDFQQLTQLRSVKFV